MKLQGSRIRNQGPRTGGSGAPPACTGPANRGQRGFALLITVTLLAFLVLLLVGLAAYSRVETAVAGNTQRQAAARQNALLALDVALGQLQKFTGPDQRVTATADSFGGVNGTRHFTGVWSSDPANPSSGATPLTWLVSGNEAQGAPLARGPKTTLTTTGANPTGAELVGKNAAGTANDVVAPLVAVAAVGVPGAAGATATTVGRYAWWVGDQGVKAPVALSDRSTGVTYSPFGSGTAQTDLGTRIRQQVSLGAGAADGTTGVAIFEPRDTTGTTANPSNATLANSVIATSQMAFFKKTTGTVGLTTLQQNFHVWSPNNLNVLTNTRQGGLRQDLSLRPELLGAAFAAWANYEPARGGYMESLTAPSDPVPLPAFSSNPLRRRYRITPAVSEGGLVHSVTPVLSFFGLSFSFRNDTATGTPNNLEVSARCVIGLWNPYSAGLVPEDLQVVITGLRDVNVLDTTGVLRHVDLLPAYGGSLKFSLPFTSNGSDPDHSTWLPGRVYNWSAISNTADPGGLGNPMEFYRRDATPAGGSGVVRNAGAPLAGGTTNYRICSVTSTQTLTIELRRASDGQLLRTFTSPQFSAFVTSGNVLTTGALSSDFAYVFRLPNGGEIPAGESAPWLQADGRDPRQDPFPTTGWVIAGGQPAQPELLVTPGQAGFPASYPQLLLDRYTDAAGKSYNEDAPVFELPRAPLLSLGSVQHMQVDGVRPFAIGNSWGLARNAIFDQYFFSGLTPEALWTDPTKPLPNPLLTVLRRATDGTAISASDLNGTARIADGFSAKYLLQAGSFNLNSVSKAAWIAALRSVRFPTTADFRFLNASTTTGTAADSSTTLADPLLTNSRVAVFPRFGQSAHETFQADDGYIQSEPGTPTSVANTPLFRRGLRILSSAEVATLADRIITLMKAKHADSGPFLSLADFLSPNPLFVNSTGGTVSLLEKAIEDAALNTESALGLTSTLAEFSSQWLTQGDIMTALAPVLFPRSDTFLIRAYGEAVNPATAATEGRAWCEALVQRVPEYVDKSEPEETAPALLNATNAALGRRYKVISFRWLTRSDI